MTDRGTTFALVSLINIAYDSRVIRRSLSDWPLAYGVLVFFLASVAVRVPDTVTRIVSKFRADARSRSSGWVDTRAFVRAAAYLFNLWSLVLTVDEVFRA